MKKLKSNEIRNLWIKFFEKHEHHYVEPKSLIPVNDNSLLWINSGVATLKSYFDGSQNPPAPRLVNVQKSLRTNDVSNVGVTSRHHTLFEMLGNFSIGDYFKEKAIQMGIEFLTSEEFLAIEKEKLYYTVFEEDYEAIEILKNENIDENHIILAPRKTNFWDMGQGPCGPNCEIFYDRGEKFDPENIGTDLIKFDYDHNERFIEVWNIVFSEFNNDGKGNYSKLPRQNIDTGAGFERLVSLSQNGYTNFDSDLFIPLIETLQKSANVKYNADNYFVKDENQTKINTAYKVIVDHMRAVVFAISDGAYPSNEGRGYVLRRLIRRSMLFARKLGINDNVLYLLVDVIAQNYGDFYKNVEASKELIKSVILKEEESFSKTIEQGEKQLIKLIESNNLTSHEVFVLYDTYGFPFELSKEIANEYNVVIDETEFKAELELQRQKSKQASNIDLGMKQQSKTLTNLDVDTTFAGYENTSCETNLVAIFDENEFYNQTPLNSKINVIFEKTPFYATKGGQVCDTGFIYIDNEVVGNVEDVFLGPNQEHIHVTTFNKNIDLNSSVKLSVDENKRKLISSNHSATHLVHQALFEKLGSNLKQAGSFQDEFKSRFDFSVFADFNKFELMKEIEDVVNFEISKNLNVVTNEVTYKEATSNDKVFAEFEAKYDDLVRLVSIGDYSYELCGGTHVSNTSDIQKIYIRNISSKGSNVYRVEFITTDQLISNELMTIKEELLGQISSISENDKKEIVNKINSQDLLSQEFVQAMQNDINSLKKQLKKKQSEVQVIDFDGLNSYTSNDTKIFVNIYEEQNVNFLRSVGDAINNNSDKFISVVLNKGEKKTIIITCSGDYNANNIMKILNEALECRGGGKPHMAQGSYQTLVDEEDIIKILSEVV